MYETKLNQTADYHRTITVDRAHKRTHVHLKAEGVKDKPNEQSVAGCLRISILSSESSFREGERSMRVHLVNPSDVSFGVGVISTHHKSLQL